MTTGPALLLVFAATDTGTEPVGSPGLIGFLVTLALVLACIPLFRSMTSKVRGVQYRDHADDVAAEDSAGDSAGTGVASTGGATSGDATGSAAGSAIGQSGSSPAGDAG